MQGCLLKYVLFDENNPSFNVMEAQYSTGKESFIIECWV